MLLLLLLLNVFRGALKMTDMKMEDKLRQIGKT